MGVGMVVTKGEGMYMGLILAWAGPFLLLLWYGTPELQMWVCLENAADGSRSLAYQFIACLPLSNTLLPVVLPWNMGHRVRDEARIPPLGRPGNRVRNRCVENSLSALALTAAQGSRFFLGHQYPDSVWTRRIR